MNNLIKICSRKFSSSVSGNPHRLFYNFTGKDMVMRYQTIPQNYINKNYVCETDTCNDILDTMENENMKYVTVKDKTSNSSLGVIDYNSVKELYNIQSFQHDEDIKTLNDGHRYGGN
tara:strand:+ start:102 stop:452 length:351 start_codon:yes stop_codon:yes gene_type:complete